jgi:flagellar basal body rod protein FlgG
MNYGLYLSATGALSSLHRQDVLANNLANVETVGFKPDMVLTRQRPPQRLEGSATFTEPQWLLEQLGGGHLTEPTRPALARQGALTATGNPLDLAIEGRGLFVVSAAPGDAGPAGAADLRLTRDGRMTVSAGGELVTAGSGMPVLDADLKPIRLAGAGPVEVRSDGTILRDGAAVARIRLVDVDGAALHKAGSNLFRLAEGGGAAALQGAAPATGSIRAGFVESSAVDPIRALSDLIATTRAAQANMRLMQYHDFIMGQAINTVGRVA